MPFAFRHPFLVTGHTDLMVYIASKPCKPPQRSIRKHTTPYSCQPPRSKKVFGPLNRTYRNCAVTSFLSFPGPVPSCRKPHPRTGRRCLRVARRRLSSGLENLGRGAESPVGEGSQERRTGYEGWGAGASGTGHLDWAPHAHCRGAGVPPHCHHQAGTGTDTVPPHLRKGNAQKILNKYPTLNWIT